MAGKTAATIEIELIDRVSQGLRTINKNFKKSATEWNSKLELVKKAWRGLNFVMDNGVVAGAEYEKQLARLQGLLGGVTPEAQRARQEIETFNNRMSRGFDLSRAQLAKFQAQFASAGLGTEEIRQATQAAIGLSQVYGETKGAGGAGVSLPEAAAKMLRVFKGQKNAVQELLGPTKSLTETKQKLSDIFNIASKEVDTFANSMAGARRALQNFSEDVGRGVAESAVLLKTFGELSEAITGDAEDIKGAVKGLVDVTIASLSELLVPFAKLQNNAVVAFERVRQSAALAFAVLTRDPEKIKAALNDLNAQVDTFGRRYVESVRRIQAELGEQVISAPNTSGFVGPQEAPEDAAAARKAKAAAAKRKREAEQAFQEEIEMHEKFNELDARAQEKELAQFNDRLQKVADQRAIEREQREQALQQERDWYERRAEEHRAFNDRYKQLGAQLISFTGQTMASFVAEIAAGENAGDSFKKMTAGLMQELGRTLIGLGTASIAYGILQQGAPLLFGLTGGAAIAAGAGAVAVGTALVAGGAAISPNTATDNTESVAERRTFGSGAQGRNGINGIQQGGGTSQTVVVNINGPVGGSPRRVANDLQKMLNQGATLAVGAR